MTRRAFFGLLLGSATITQTDVTAQRDTADGSNEIPRPEGFILSGPLTRATDGSDSWTIGRVYLGMHPDSALIPSTKTLEGQRVRLSLERA